MIKEDWELIINNKIEEARQRSYKKRGWIKLSKSWLTSSINYRMELSEIAVYSKLIVMADEFGPVPGLISDNDFRPMPHEYLAHIACCPLEIFESTLEKCIKDASIYENAHGIFLTHFDEYQFTEYDRQKPYRQDKQKREYTPEQKKDQEYIQELGLRSKRKREELGRQLTVEEERIIKNEVAAEIYETERPNGTKE